MYSLGIIASSFGRGAGGFTTDADPSVSTLSGVATVTYTVTENERNKPPVVNDLVLSANPGFEVDGVITATIDGTMFGPFTAGTHEYQWYKVTDTQDDTLVEISGATSSTYTPVLADLGAYLICKARFVQVEGVNTESEWFYSEMSDAVAESTGGQDIEYAWADHFNIETGESVSATWNTDVNPSLINLGSGADWVTVDATKPSFSTDKLVFAGNHRVEGYNIAWPPVFEVWIKARFTDVGALLCQGNQVLFTYSGTGYVVNGGVEQPGDTTEHVFRIVFKGATSIFQIDGGAEIEFDEATTTAQRLILGQTNSGGQDGDFELKLFQRTPDGNYLTTQEVADKWAYHGF